MSLRNIIEELERGEGKESTLLRAILKELEEVEKTVTLNTWQINRIHGALDVISASTETILFLVRAIAAEVFPVEPVDVVIIQGDNMLTGTIKGLLPGGTDNFFATPVDKDGNADALPTGSPVPTFTSDNTSVVVTTAADGLSASVTAPADATPGSSFNLTWDVTYTNPNDNSSVNINKTVSVPILTPPALEPVDVVLSQGAPAA